MSEANTAAVAAIDDWQNWPSGKLLLVGAKGAGKTHLAHVWAEDADARVVAANDLRDDDIADLVEANPRIALEDIDAISTNPEAQKAAFHLHNLILAEGGRLLITTSQSPATMPMSLPDLQSRLSGTGAAHLTLPDDPLLCAVMVKQFADRQIDVPLNVIAYLAPRIDRSFASAARVVSELDRMALAENRPVTRDLARRVMDKLSPSES